MEQSIVLMSGICFTILGLSLFFRAKDWRKYLNELERRNRQAAIAIGSINLMVGSFIVAFHPVWNGWLMLLTIIGVMAIAKGIVYTLFPQSFGVMLKLIHPKQISFLHGAGLIWALIGIGLLLVWCSQRQGLSIQEMWGNLVI